MRYRRSRYSLVSGASTGEKVVAVVLLLVALAQAIIIPASLWFGVLAEGGDLLSALVLSALSVLVGVVYSLLAFESYRF